MSTPPPEDPWAAEPAAEVSEEAESDAAILPADAAATPITEQWQRLNPLMLLLGPISALKEIAVPFIVALVGVTATTDQPPLGFALVGAAFLVFLGAIPWLTTRYLLTDAQLQVRTGLINKKRLTANLERVRTVDVTATLLHRLLGLAKVEVGTGVDNTRIELNALSSAQAEEMAHALRTRSATARARLGAGGPPDEMMSASPDDVGMPPEPTDVLATIDWSWLRFAPLSLSRLVVLAGAFGVASQFINMATLVDAVSNGYDSVRALGVFVAGLLIALGGLVIWLIVSMGGYVVGWVSYRLTATPTTVQLSAGLLTTRSITIEQAKLRGVVVEEPVLLRMARGGQLTALATGVGLGGSTEILPPAPITVCRAVGGDVLRRGAPESADSQAAIPTADPLTVSLIPHGPAARRRCHVRAQLAQLFWLAVIAVAAWWWALGWWALAPAAAVIGWGAMVGEQAYRHLGHALTADHLVMGDGLLTRRRTVIERAGILGWVVNQNLFQRRAGLVSVTVPIAAGGESVLIRDVPIVLAFPLADAATPGLLTEFAEPSPVG